MSPEAKAQAKEAKTEAARLKKRDAAIKRTLANDSTLAKIDQRLNGLEKLLQANIKAQDWSETRRCNANIAADRSRRADRVNEILKLAEIP